MSSSIKEHLRSIGYWRRHGGEEEEEEDRGGISYVPTTEVDLVLTALLALESDALEAPLVGHAVGLKKHPHPKLAKEEILAIHKKVAKIAIQLKS
ncbi:uncharacterized protein A4U43_UnF4470 [Asparagus officinalis]|uniref:Uncharacterized protein n=1 Tax=Asparagus officinalis TaxID=4686 RepID=A0A1R3L6V3_ASPOF|nr:uncharacterized protein A4U43_UnF4470 [Asparagus officinalis]